MYQSGNVLVSGEVKVVVTPVIPVEIPNWMQKLSTMVSTVYLSNVKIRKEYSKRPASALRSWAQLVTKDGDFLSLVGDKDWQQNKVAWRRFLHIRYDPTDTIEEALLRLGDKAKEIVYLCEESVNGYGETHFSFFPIQKI